MKYPKIMKCDLKILKYVDMTYGHEVNKHVLNNSLEKTPSFGGKLYLYQNKFKMS